MEIIPKVNDRVIYAENGQRIAICAYLGENCEVETSIVFDLSKKDKEKVFDAYVARSVGEQVSDIKTEKKANKKEPICDTHVDGA